MTLSTVGYGDIHSFNTSKLNLQILQKKKNKIVERFTAIILIVVGAGFYSFMIGSISTILSNLDTRNAHLLNKITIMDEFCREAKINKKLRFKLRKALNYISIKSIFS